MNINHSHLLGVIDLIREQRYLSDGDIFVYDLQFAKKKLLDMLKSDKKDKLEWRNYRTELSSV